MAKGRKLTATFSDGSTLTRTTSIATLSHAYRADVQNLPNPKTGWAGSRFVSTGFASGADKAEAAVRREFPTKGRDGAYVVHSLEIVACVEG